MGSRFKNFTREKDIYYLKKAVEVSEKAIESGNNPFGAILVDLDGNILMEQGNVEVTEKECTGHAETTLARKASGKYDRETLWNCTLYTTVEPCAMCTGAIYWANIGRIVYGIEETKLLEMTGDNPKNPTMSLSCRNVIAAGQKDIEVVGPVDEVKEDVLKVHEGFWD
ncbi:MAG: nucleoside deaminase [Clostridia bacterium]|jgi:tRNA(Arg) A34 adenosine deaminase TadA|nr:nucleoside deaminase [Clostridia bacterium]